MSSGFVIEDGYLPPSNAGRATSPPPAWQSERADSAAGELSDHGQGADSHAPVARAVGDSARPPKVEAEPVDVGTLPAKYARAKLNTANEVADEIARVYRLAKAGKMDSAVATKLTYILATLAKVRGDSEIERRIEALEARRIN